ncbi:MAG TPA: 3-phosphoglycerate dehydrogenase [Spirochaetes bacterium]|nr:3-phosphoglycerate dehydrogenase [Spirochaetota bacterium]
MLKIRTLNPISPVGLDCLPGNRYEVASEIPHPDAIIVRSFDMVDMELPLSLKAIVRAGVGTNNIPVDRCSGRGIVVFNTPGANANSVKEITLAGLFISSRKILQGIGWTKTLKNKGDNVQALVEKQKSLFTGPEITGKNLGVIGLGAVGVSVSNDAAALGMNVTGYDPFISIESAWGLSRNIKRASGFDSLLANSDYITLHIPLSEETKDIINKDIFSIMKKGVRLLNFSRSELVNNKDLKEAIKKRTVAVYVTDFPDKELLDMDEVIMIPHLGASTPEAEDNCAVMAANQIRDYLENGNIVNSVNFPECKMDVIGKKRILIANKNIPRMVGQITSVLAQEGINIADMLNKSRGDLAYNIIDIDNQIADTSIKKISEIEGVLMVRVI